MKLLFLILLSCLGFFIMSAVSFDTNDPNEVIERELKDLNINLQKIISLMEAQNTHTNEAMEVQIRTLNRIFLSLQPYAYNIHGELIEN